MLTIRGMSDGSKKTFTWRNEVTGVSVFNIVLACL